MLKDEMPINGHTFYYRLIVQLRLWGVEISVAVCNKRGSFESFGFFGGPDMKVVQGANRFGSVSFEELG